MQDILATARRSGMEIVSALRLTPVLVIGAALMLTGCGNTTDPARPRMRARPRRPAATT